MKTKIRTLTGYINTWVKVSEAVAALILSITFSACQEDKNQFDGPAVGLKSSSMSSEVSVYYGPVIFSRHTGAPFMEEQMIGNATFGCYENFVLKIRNGNERKSRVSSAEVWVNGELMAGPSDFSKNVTMITKTLTGLTPHSELKVMLKSAPGSFLEIWIEGTLRIVTPIFAQIGPLVQDSDSPSLPVTSENGITGIWSPETISTANAGVFTFTFTPDEGQCASTSTMDITVSNRGTVTDADGNEYETVKIGSQWWMAENLKSTLYNNGDPIGTTSPATLNISPMTEPKYQWAYNGNEESIETYGRYYTWYAVTDTRGVCPTGWHIPSDAEWKMLSDYLIDNGYGYDGSGSDIGKSLAATSGWLTNATAGNVGNNQGSNNNSGFTAMAGGARNPSGSFDNASYAGFWRSSASGSYRSLYSNSGELHSNTTSNKFGMSVRCVKD